MLSSKNLMKNKKKKGFSLLEIVVSLGLIALFIIPVGNMVLGTVKINKATEDKQQASAVLQETVEQIKSLEEFPKEVGNTKSLPNGAVITRDVDEADKKKYVIKLSSSGIEVSGNILEEDVFSETVEVPGDGDQEDNDSVTTEVIEKYKEEKVDGVIYYINNKASYSIGERSIQDSVNNIEGYIDSGIESSSVSIKIRRGFPDLWNYYFKINDSYDEMSINNSFLVVMDNPQQDFEVYFEKTLTEIDFSRYKVYVYARDNKDKFDVVSREEVNCINVGQDIITNPEPPDNDSEEIKLGLSKVSVSLQYKKDNKNLENMHLDYVKSSKN